MKASLHLVLESILFLVKEINHSLAFPLKEKGNNFSLIISPSISICFCISQSSTKLFKWEAASSLPIPENCSLITRLNIAGFISKKVFSATGGAIGVLIKSLLLVLVKSHNLVFSRVVIFLGFQIRKQTCKTNFFCVLKNKTSKQSKKKLSKTKTTK